MHSTHNISSSIMPKSTQLVYGAFGDPNKVLTQQEVDVPAELTANQVRILWIGSTINPSDVVQISGTYPNTKTLPIVGGNEGVAVVDQVGASVKGFEKGDWVIPGARQMGTWQTQSVVEAKDLIKIDKRLPLEIAAQSLVNPPTAYRMLHDFVKLQPADVVLQNGANSAVGRYVIQICKLNGWKTVNIVRHREKESEMKELVDDLKSLGADLVVTDKEFQAKTAEVLKPLGRAPVLAFDCVGGAITVSMGGALQPGGKLVNYGAMSKQPVMISPGDLIVKGIEVHGFWLSHAKVPEADVKKCVVWLTEQFLAKKLVSAHCDMVEWKDWKKAVQIAVSGTGNKQVLMFNKL